MPSWGEEERSRGRRRRTFFLGGEEEEEEEGVNATSTSMPPSAGDACFRSLKEKLAEEGTRESLLKVAEDLLQG